MKQYQFGIAILQMEWISLFFLLGFSTLRRNLRESRLSITNERLNAILVLKINIPVLRLVVDDFNNVLINNAVKKYFAKKKWRWAIRPEKDDVNRMMVKPSLPKKRRLDEISNEDFESSDGSSIDDSSEADESDSETNDIYDIEEEFVDNE